MEAVKKYWFWGIFISILSIFAMSHNANAVELSLNLDNYTIVRGIQGVGLECTITNGLNTTVSGSSFCMGSISSSANMSISQIETANTYNVKAGDILSFYLIIQSQTSALEYTPVLNNLSNSAHGWQILSFSEVTREDFANSQNSTGGYINWAPNNDFGFSLYEMGGYSRIYEFVMRATSNGSYHYGLYSPTALYIFNRKDSGNQIWFSLRNFIHYRYSGSEENKEVEEKTQEAVDESETAGSGSSSSAQQGTTGLLNAITGAVSVISSAQPTNCKINGNMGNLDMGQLDLCANPAPAFVQTIGSLILILMCVPLAISLFNRFIAIFRSFQS